MKKLDALRNYYYKDERPMPRFPEVDWKRFIARAALSVGISAAAADKVSASSTFEDTSSHTSNPVVNTVDINPSASAVAEFGIKNEVATVTKSNDEVQGSVEMLTPTPSVDVEKNVATPKFILRDTQNSAVVEVVVQQASENVCEQLNISPEQRSEVFFVSVPEGVNIRTEPSTEFNRTIVPPDQLPSRQLVVKPAVDDNTWWEAVCLYDPIGNLVTPVSQPLFVFTQLAPSTSFPTPSTEIPQGTGEIPPNFVLQGEQPTDPAPGTEVQLANSGEEATVIETPAIQAVPTAQESALSLGIDTSLDIGEDIIYQVANYEVGIRHEEVPEWINLQHLQELVQRAEDLDVGIMKISAVNGEIVGSRQAEDGSWIVIARGWLNGDGYAVWTVDRSQLETATREAPTEPAPSSEATTPMITLTPENIHQYQIPTRDDGAIVLSGRYSATPEMRAAEPVFASHMDRLQQERLQILESLPLLPLNDEDLPSINGVRLPRWGFYSREEMQQLGITLFPGAPFMIVGRLNDARRSSSNPLEYSFTLQSEIHNESGEIPLLMEWTREENPNGNSLHELMLFSDGNLSTLREVSLNSSQRANRIFESVGEVFILSGAQNRMGSATPDAYSQAKIAAEFAGTNNTLNLLQTGGGLTVDTNLFRSVEGDLVFGM